MSSVGISIREIGQRIYVIRGHRVMLDSDLAELYEVETKALKRAVRRNIERFPQEDFMFELSRDEYELLRRQFGTSKKDDTQDSRGGARYLPFVFTEQGVSMLSSVLKSGCAIQVNVTIMRTFVKLREMLETNKELAKKLDHLEKKYDHQFKVVFDASGLKLSLVNSTELVGALIGKPCAARTPCAPHSDFRFLVGLKSLLKTGESRRIRTVDPLIKSEMLYRLSYGLSKKDAVTDLYTPVHHKSTQYLTLLVPGPKSVHQPRKRLFSPRAHADRNHRNAQATFKVFDISRELARQVAQAFGSFG